LEDVRVFTVVIVVAEVQETSRFFKFVSHKDMHVAGTALSGPKLCPEPCSERESSRRLEQFAK
jgi:hypothetical protein